MSTTRRNDFNVVSSQSMLIKTPSVTEQTRLVSMSKFAPFSVARDNPNEMSVTQMTVSPTTFNGGASQSNIMQAIGYSSTARDESQPTLLQKQWLNPTFQSGRGQQSNPARLNDTQLRPQSSRKSVVVQQQSTNFSQQSSYQQRNSYHNQREQEKPLQQSFQATKPPKGPLSYEASTFSLDQPQMLLSNPVRHPQVQHHQLVPQTMRTGSSTSLQGNSFRNHKAKKQQQPIQIYESRDEQSSSLEVTEQHQSVPNQQTMEQDYLQHQSQPNEHVGQYSNQNQYRFGDLTAFDSDTSLLLPQQQKQQENDQKIDDVHHQQIQTNQFSDVISPADTSLQSIVNVADNTSAIYSPQINVAKIRRDESKEHVLRQKNNAIDVSDMRMIDTYTSGDQKSFRKRLVQMQQDLQKTSDLLTLHKQRQSQVAQKWQIKTSGDNSNMLKKRSSSTVATTKIHQRKKSGSNCDSKIQIIHQPASTEMSPRSAERLNFAHLLNSGRDGSIYPSHLLQNQQQLSSNNPDKFEMKGRDVVITATSFDLGINTNVAHIKNKQQNDPTTGDQDYFERNHRPSTKRDQKITYSQTSLDEMQFMKHIEKIKQKEKIEQGHDMVPQQQSQVAVRSKSLNNSHYSTRNHQSNTFSSAIYHAKAPTQNFQQTQELPNLETSEHNSHGIHRDFSQTQSFLPKSPIFEEGYSLRNRLNQLNELLSTQKRMEKATSESHENCQQQQQLQALSSFEKTTSTERAAAYLEQRRLGETKFEQTTMTQEQMMIEENQTFDLSREIQTNPENENENVNENEEIRQGPLIELLEKIGISENHIWKFKQQEIGLYDFFLLTKDDLIELDLPIAARNRIIAFQRHYANENQINLLDDENLPDEINDFDINQVLKQAARSESATTTPFGQSQHCGGLMTQQTMRLGGLMTMNNNDTALKSSYGQNYHNHQNASASNGQTMKNYLEKTTNLNEKKDHRRPRTSMETRNNQVMNNTNDDYDDYQFTRNYARNLKGTANNHFQSAMTEILSGEKQINTSSVCSPAAAQAAHERLIIAEEDQDSTTRYLMSSVVTDTTQPHVFTSATPTADHDSLSSDSSRSYQIEKNPNRKNHQRRASSVGPSYPLTNKSAQYQRNLNKFGQDKNQQKQYKRQKHPDSSTLNTLSTSEVGISKNSAVGKTTPSQIEDQKSKKKVQAKQLYKELKQMLCSPSEKQSIANTSSMHSLLLDRIYRKVSQRGNSYQQSSREFTKLDQEKLIKRELKKAVRRIMKASNDPKLKQYDCSMPSSIQVSQPDLSQLLWQPGKSKIISISGAESTHDFAKRNLQNFINSSDIKEGLISEPRLDNRDFLQEGITGGNSYQYTTTQESDIGVQQATFMIHPSQQQQQNNQSVSGSVIPDSLMQQNSSAQNQKQNHQTSQQLQYAAQTCSFGHSAQFINSESGDYEQGSKDRQNYIEALKLMQKGGGIGSLGMGSINLDKLQNHLQRLTKSSPSAKETRCFTAANQAAHTNSTQADNNNDYDEQSSQTAKEEKQSQVSSNADFFKKHYTFAGREGYGSQSQNSRLLQQSSSQVTQQHQSQQLRMSPSSTTQKHTPAQAIRHSIKERICESSIETERAFPYDCKEASLRNKQLLQQAKQDIASMNIKAAEFKTKLQFAKDQVSGGKKRILHSFNQSVSLQDETKSTVVL